ncbi:MAG: TrmH family RNA methyltransferase, partial [Acidimicrobiia bacterium]
GVAGLDAAVSWVRDRGARIVAADPEASDLLWDADLTGPLALLVGAEDTGLTASARAEADTIIAIPMRGSTDSLNVAVSMGVLAYEALRQRST